MKFKFIVKHRELKEVLLDDKLAKLGDAYVNFIYSLALSNRKGEAYGKKVKGKILAEALKLAGLRELLPRRVDSHKLADAAEALIVYSWAKDAVTAKEAVKILGEAENDIEGFKELLILARRRLKF